MTGRAIIIGYSGHSYVVLDAARSQGFDVLGYIDREKKVINPYELDYLGSDTDANYLRLLSDNAVFIAIGSNQVRQRIFLELEAAHIYTPPLIHNKAILSLKAQLGPATIVMAGAVVNALARVGKGVICNTSCVIEHECTIGDFTHIAPGAVLTGNVRVGSRTFIGANSVVRQGIVIGNNVTIGAGSVIIQDIPDNSLVYGNPGKIR